MRIQRKRYHKANRKNTAGMKNVERVIEINIQYGGIMTTWSLHYLLSNIPRSLLIDIVSSIPIYSIFNERNSS